MHFPFRLSRHGRTQAFTLVEMLVSIAVLVLLLAIVFAVLSQTASTIQSANSESTAFEGSRVAFDVLSQKLSQATLNTYWAYDNPASPTKYLRKSDLDFVIQANGNYGQQVSFEAPLAYSDNPTYGQAQGLLNACSYSVVYGSDDAIRPPFVAQQRWRYRLMQTIQPAENLAVFADSAGSWINSNLLQWNWPFVDNVIAMILWPRLSKDADPAGTQISANYLYDSRSGSAIQVAQMPPIVAMTLVIVDEKSMARLNPSGTPPGAIENALKNKFTDVTMYQTDLNNLTNALNGARIRYEVMTGSVTMKESEWSSTP